MPQDNNPKPGKTGDYPNGKLNKHDEGGIRVAIGVKDGVVILDFGTPVIWVGLDKKSAETIGKSLIDHAGRLPS